MVNAANMPYSKLLWMSVVVFTVLVASPAAASRRLRGTQPTACPEKPGYTVALNSDAVGGSSNSTLTALTEWLEDPEAACSQNATCQAFSLRSDGRGQIKSTGPLPGGNLATFASEGSCVYIKAATPCPAKAGFSRLVDYDHQGNDLTTWLDDPAEYCSNSSTCQGFNLRLNKTGQPKTATLKGAFYSHNVCLYTKSDIACPPRLGYKVLVDVAHEGDDISDKVSDPFGACNKDPTCQGFSMSSLSGSGQTKSNTTIVYSSPGNCLYVKTVTSCPPKAGYSRLVDYDHAYNDLSNWISDPAAACDGKEDCVGFNLKLDGLGMIKAQTLKDAFYSHGYCLYTKAGAACPAKEGYSAVVDADHARDDLSSEVVEDPHSACDADTLCNGFTMSSLTGVGVEKLVTSPIFVSPGTCLYTKQR